MNVAPVILAVDPATRSGWALFEGDRLVDSGAIQTLDDDGPLALSLVPIFALVPGAAELRVLAIECHTFVRGQAATRRLTEARSAWETIGRMRGFDVLRVNACRWQADILGRAGAGASAQRKAMARAIAWDVGRTRLRELGDDEADAICIGLWACARFREERRRERAIA